VNIPIRGKSGILHKGRSKIKQNVKNSSVISRLRGGHGCGARTPVTAPARGDVFGNGFRQ